MTEQRGRKQALQQSEVTGGDVCMKVWWGNMSKGSVVGEVGGWVGEDDL